MASAEFWTKITDFMSNLSKNRLKKSPNDEKAIRDSLGGLYYDINKIKKDDENDKNKGVVYKK